MLADEVPNYAKYAPLLKASTIFEMANLYLEGIIANETTLQNLVLRDQGEISNDEFFARQMARVYD